MKTTALSIAIVLSQCLCVAQSSQKPSTTTGSSKAEATVQQKPQRVHANVKGFELSPASKNSTTQIGGATRGVGTATTLLAPHKGLAFSQRPFFQWFNPNKNIKTYEFKLFDSDRSTLLFNTNVSGTSLKYPPDAPELQPARSYFWTVEPLISLLGNPAEAAEIVLVGSPDREQLESQLANLPESSPQRADVFADNRVWYDAIECYSDKLRVKPDDAELLHRRAELYDQLPQTQPAAQADLRAAGSPGERPH